MAGGKRKPTGIEPAMSVILASTREKKEQRLQVKSTLRFYRNYLYS
jgi:hypothetical protein